MTPSTAALTWTDALDAVINDTIAPAAEEVDAAGAFPRAGIDALARADILGLLSAGEVGGGGHGLREAAEAVERIARVCGSTAMVTMMHFCAVAVIEKAGPRDVREAVAAGRHLSTLAFSEAGSRAHFWAPVSTARVGDRGVALDARKSWVTSAGEADSYVWSSRPVAAAAASTLWLVAASTPGLRVGPPFAGLGLRGNASTTIAADGVEVPASAMLGADGDGFDLMMGVVLPTFQVLNAAVAVGTMETATRRTAEHATATRYEHLGQTLADMPTARAQIARMRTTTDQARALLLDTLTALETGREDAMLRVLEVKAAAGEAVTAVTDLAMRVCGGAAFRREVGVERNFRDARAAGVMAPTTDALHDFIGRVVCGLPLFDAPAHA
ncbi:MAG TPA: acyl-CoA dehydrogenase [Candidatus Dormibacteraeota bacterium]|nr:acyl-CoA dehydrogenase [Candidatus Dormibacteraeota bacterium]